MRIQRIITAVVLFSLTAVASPVGAADAAAPSQTARTLAVIPFYSPV